MIIRTKGEIISLWAAFVSFGLGGIAGALAPTHAAAVVIVTLTAMLWALAFFVGALAGRAMGWSIWALGLSAGAVMGAAISEYHPGSGSALLAVAACTSCIFVGVEIVRVLRTH
ncbi:MAG TPA: hypothetical protein VEJ16_14130 [Alphaproteobacteria bacterium]|nr:hypothetical protein [Alphaproteobacteria bacterium]